jgi:hypothetical protein
MTTSDSRLDADQFERKLSITKRVYADDQEIWKGIERAMRRRRALKRMDDPSAAERSEIDELLSRAFSLSGKYFASFLMRGLRLRVWHGYLVLPVLILFTILSTAAAINQASHVINGTAGSTGNQDGVFDYNVESVSVVPTGSGDEGNINSLIGKKLYFLGEITQYVISI